MALWWAAGPQRMCCGANISNVSMRETSGEGLPVVRCMVVV